MDTRRLPRRAGSTELRYDPVLGTWVMYASHRQGRSYLPSADDCPLCPSAPGHSTEIPEPDYEVVVFENRFPALVAPLAAGTVRSGDGAGGRPVAGASPVDGADGRGPAVLSVARAGAGRCEVVCYSADHCSSFAQLSAERVGTLVAALADRTVELGDRSDVELVFCFENRGREIGVTQPHPHGQIYAYPFVPDHMARSIGSAEAYRRSHGRNLFDDLVAQERAQAVRMVLAAEHWSAFVPHAARWPFEVHCYPVQRVPDLASLSAPARAELPEVLLDVYGRFDRLFGRPAPYVAGWYQAPAKRSRAEFALHLEIFTLRRTADKLKYLAGSESGMGAFANDVAPEEAAERLRSV